MMRLAGIALLAFTMLSPQGAKADCMTPAGVAGDQFFNSTYSRMQYCDGANWINMGGGGGSGSGDDLGDHTATTALLMGANFIDFSEATGDKILWYSNTYGTGIESGTLTNWAGTNHRWRIGGTSVSTGLERMLLNTTGLTVTGTITGNGSGLTNLNASNLATGTVPAARLGTGTADGTTYLRGDGSWQTISSGLPSLTSANIWVGNGSNVATAIAMSGDATLSSSGVLTLAANSVSAAEIAADTITAADIAPNAVTSSELADDAVTIAKLAATGTPSATTFLRGDNTWATPSSGVSASTYVSCSDVGCNTSCASGWIRSGCAVSAGGGRCWPVSGEGCQQSGSGTTCTAICVQ